MPHSKHTDGGMFIPVFAVQAYKVTRSCLEQVFTTVNLVKLATGRGLRGALVATKWGNPLIEVTCNNNEVEVQSCVCCKFY